MNAAVETGRLRELYNPERRKPSAEDRDGLRVPPQAIEAEQAVLGGLMLAPDAWDEVADLLQPEDFYRRDHATIFEAVAALRAKSKPYDAVTLGEWFEARGQAELVFGGAYLIELASTTPSAANIRAYAEIVADKATRRRLIEVGTDIVNDGFQTDGRGSDEVVADAAAKVAHLTLRTAKEGGLRMLRSGIGEAYDEIVARWEGTADVGLTPPWANVRNKLPGLENTDFAVLAARPGMGKTVAALEWADHAAELGRNVAVFSLEMSRRQLITRLISRRARVPLTLMRQRGALTDQDFTEISRANRELHALPMAIDDTATLTIEGIKARSSRMHAKVEGGLGLIVVDYLQLISGSGRDDKRHDEISKISRGLKLLAKDLNCPVIGLSQLNRSVETRADKRPVMADLRESGAIEQDADVICFLYRDDYYSKDACGAPGVAEFIIAKQRQGALGTAYLRHRLECSTFTDYHGPTPSYTLKHGKASQGSDGFDDHVLSGRDRAAGID